MTSKDQVKGMISEIRKGIRRCKTINDYVDFAFSFQYKGHSFEPLQIKNEIKILLEVLKKEKPKTILEIGTANGGTLFLLSKVAAKDAKIISIDLPNGPFGGEGFPDWKIPIYKTFVTNKQKIHFIRSDSHNKKTLENLKKIIGKRKIDFLLIDGDHTYEGVKKDFEMYNTLVKDDGLIAIHDVSYGPKENVGQVPQFWNKIKSRFKTLEITINDNSVGYGIGLLFKKNCKTDKFHKILNDVIGIQNITILEKTTNLLSLNKLKQQKKIDISNLKSFIKQKDAELKELRKIIGKKDNDVEGFQKQLTKVNQLIRNKDGEFSSLKSLVKEKESQYTTLEKLANEREKYAKELEEAVKEKDAHYVNLEKLANERERYAKELERTMQLKDEHYTTLDELSKSKEIQVSDLTNHLKQKEMDIIFLNNSMKKKEYQLIELRNNLSEIEKSIMFNMMRKVSRKIDSAFPNRTKRGEFKKIVASSASMISDDGFQEYLSSVKTKVKRREYRVLEPLNLPKSDEKILQDIVINNRKKRLKIKSHGKGEIKNDEFKISEKDELL